MPRTRACAAVVAVVALGGGAVLDAAAPRPNAPGAAAYEPPPVAWRAARPMAGSEGCLHCHEGIEEMHPGFPLSCVDCHGGDATTTEKMLAHVQPTRTDPGDERVEPKDADLAYRRFVNPMDLRVAEVACGECHGDLVRHLELSLHGTTAGHLSDGFYEMGLVDEVGSRYAVFPVSDTTAEEGSMVERLVQPPAFDPGDDETELATHFPDLIRKECMQCHLWSEGRAVRGRVGFNGDYRGAGCAACHVPYAVNGLTETADRTAPRNEPGHPRRHVLTSAPPTSTCTSCHYGDASIGLHFRGLSQLPPNAPGGPEIPGTTDVPLNRQYYLDDPATTPPDVHHQSGMHCVDCHTLGDVMGDGRLLGQMEHAVEIACETCHGTFHERTDFRTERGTRMEHLFERDGEVWMRSKVTGAEHRVKQAADVVDPDHEDYNAAAAEAMTDAHGSVECYTCHAGWNVNFLGFHFYRNEQLSQLDLLSGRRTPGRVTTQEKVFATWKSFYAGLNETGRVAPYLTGFSTMGTVDDEDGNRVLDQAMPVTAKGLSGLTMIHHQLHSTRPTARSCVECHRSPSTWGLGSANFRLARQLAFMADRRGIEVVAVDRANPAASVPLAKFVLPDVVDLALHCDPLQGHAHHVYASEGARGIHVLDVTDPAHPRRVAFTESISPRGLALSGDHLFVADGVGGLKVYDVSEPAEIHRVGSLPTLDAHAIEVRWPYAYVADGPGGLLIVDVRDPSAPRVAGGMGLVGHRGDRDSTVDLDVLFQYSRPLAEGGVPTRERTEARMLVAAIDEATGLVLVDATEPSDCEIVWPSASGRRTAARMPSPRNSRWLGVSLRSHVDLATPQGGERTVERDYAYVLEERGQRDGRGEGWIRVVDVSDPERVEFVGTRYVSRRATRMLTHAAFYTTPFLRPVAFMPGIGGVQVVDLSLSGEPNPLGAVAGLRSTWVVAVEEFPLDRMVDPSGAPLKDVSHAPSRWLRRDEILRVLDVDAERLGTIGPYAQPQPIVGAAARAVFGRRDADGSGMLTGDELGQGGGGVLDRDGDGRATLLEVVELGDDLDDGRSGADEDAGRVFLATRTDEDGDLARLLDGIDPHAFDRRRDDRLEREEATSAVFAALDLDGDERLSIAELSRYPGPLRELRYGDRTALERFDRIDRSGGGSVGRREFELADAEWEALDADGDGGVQLPVPRDSRRRGRGDVPAPSEWPTRRFAPPIALPPDVTPESLAAALDRDEDGRLTKRELRRREDLLERLDRDSDDALDPDELAAAFDAIGRQGVELAPDDFESRWDVDGDGEVEESELPELARIVLGR